jgi:drug/metabolite transporter (DMT)-like permease
MTSDRLARIPAGVLGGAFVVLWCTGYPSARIALDHAAPFALLVVRFGCAALIYATLALLGRVAWPRGRALLHGIAIGTLQLALQFGGAYYAAARGVNVGLIALVIGAMPIVTALLGRVFGDPVRPLQWLGFAFGFAGVALAVIESIHPGPGGADPTAWLALAAALIGISSGTLYQKRLGSEVDLRSGLALQHAVATLLLLPLALAEGWRWDGSWTLDATMAWLIVVNSLGGFALFYLLIRRGAVSRVAALFFLMPPVTALMDYVVLGDPFSLTKVAGIVLAAFGVYLATRADPAPAVTRSCSGT